MAVFSPRHFYAASCLRSTRRLQERFARPECLRRQRKRVIPELYALLKTMPKGADLHMHLSGAVYAETFITEGAREGLCAAPVNPGTPPVPEEPDALHFLQPQHGKANDCAAGSVPVANALKNQALYDSLIDSFSMRGFVATRGDHGARSVLCDIRAFRRLEGRRGRVA